MGILYPNEHRNCVNFVNMACPWIEVGKIGNGETYQSNAKSNEILFVLEGKIKLSKREIEYDGAKGEILFMEVGKEYSFLALSKAMFLILRVETPVILCEAYPLENLHRNGISSENDDYAMETKKPGRLKINTRLWHFLDGVYDCLSDGVSCRSWFDMKIKEFFMFLRFYYTKEELCCFFSSVLTGDIAFSEFVRVRWREYGTVSALADAMYMTARQFSRRFTAVFGETPQRWLSENMGRAILHEITSTNKTFKQIAFENGFSYESQFSRFCKKEFAKTPTEIREETKKK